MIFEAMFSGLSGDYLPSSFRIATYDELRMVFVFYSVGFVAMSLLISQLYRAVVRSSTVLALNHLELRRTRVVRQEWALAASFGLLSVLLALVVADAWVSIAGYMYFALIPAMRLPSYLDRRRTSNE
jgi:hypothetical protein